MQDVDKDFVVVGEILKPHGIRGELRVACHAQSPFLFDAVPCVYLRPGPRTPRPDPLAALGPGPLRPAQVARARKQAPARPRRVEVASWREHKDLVLLTLTGVADRDAAEPCAARRSWCARPTCPPRRRTSCSSMRSKG